MLKIQQDKRALNLERITLTNARNSDIKRLGYSLEVAKAAHIYQPVYSKGQAVKDDPDFSVVLGANGIARKLEIEKSITDISELNADIRTREYTLSLLKKFNTRNIDFAVFSYQQSPSLPMRKDGPPLILIVVLSSLLGGVMMCGYIMLSQIFSECEKSDSKNSAGF